MSKYCWTDNSCNNAAKSGGGTKTCADTDGAGGGVFDCGTHANDIHASPAGVTCDNTGCTDTKCCTVSTGGGGTTVCSKSDTVAVNAACKCDVAASTNECAMSKYCWVDNSCNDAAKITGKCTGNSNGVGDVNCAGETTNTQNKGNMVDGTEAGTCCEAPSGAANGENCAENGACQS